MDRPFDSSREGRSVDGAQLPLVENADSDSSTEQRQIQASRATDRKVRTHELAHIAAGGA